MASFVPDNTTDYGPISGDTHPKTDRNVTSTPANEKVAAADWNVYGQALKDVRTWFLGANYIGFTEGTDPAPSGMGGVSQHPYIYAKTSDHLPHWKANGVDIALGNGISGLTTGRVPFAASSTTLTDDAALVWDNTNKRLGINSSSPTEKLDIAGNIRIRSDTGYIQFYTPGDTGSTNKIGMQLGGTSSLHDIGMITLGGVDVFIDSDNIDSSLINNFQVYRSSTSGAVLFRVQTNGRIATNSASASAGDALATLDLRGHATDAAILMHAGSLASASAASTGVLRYNEGTQHWEISENTNAFAQIATVGGSAVSGSGTTSTIPVWSSSTALGDSSLTSSSGNLTLATTKTFSAGSNVLIGSVADKLNAAMLAIASQAVGDLLYANATTTFTRLAAVAAGSYLRSAGTTTAPVWSTLILPNAATVGDIPIATSSNTLTMLADVAAGSYLRSGGTSTAPVWSTLVMPNAATVGDIPIATSSNTLTMLADVAAGSYLRSGGTSTAPVWSTLVLPNAATTGDIPIATSSNTLTMLADVAAGSYLRSGGTSTAPVWSTLIIPNAATTGDIPIATATNTVTMLGAGTSGYVLTSGGAGVAPSWAAVAAAGLPSITTVSDANHTSSTSETVEMSGLTAARVVTGTTGGSTSAPLVVIIVDTDGSANVGNTISFTPSSGTIFGLTTVVAINAPYGTARFYSTGTNWRAF